MGLEDEQVKQTRKTTLPEKWAALFPSYIWPCFAVILISMIGAYCGTRLLLPFLPVYRLDMPIDAAIPFLPEWISVYYLPFLSWAVSGFVILAQGKEHARRVTRAFVIAMGLSALVFLCWPLTIERPEVEGSGLFRDLVRATYQTDQPNNLFPSLHVLMSYFCWRCLWDCPRVSRWFKGLNLVVFLLVCLSVVFVKQHLVIDIPGGIIVGEAAIQAARFPGMLAVSRAKP